MMCSRHPSGNGADSVEVTGIILDAAERCRREIARGNIGEVVYILRSLTDEEHDAVEAIILNDPEPEEASRLGPMSERGQTMVEAALVLPILLLVIVGGLVLGLATFDRQTRTWEAQEAAYAASLAGAADSACDDARMAAEAVSGRAYADCIGSDGLTMQYDPATPPGTVAITLDGGSYPVPFLDTVTVSGSATAMLRSSSSPSPSASETP